MLCTITNQLPSKSNNCLRNACIVKIEQRTITNQLPSKSYNCLRNACIVNIEQRIITNQLPSTQRVTLVCVMNAFWTLNSVQ